MPTTRPKESTRAPPELPGFSAASVWITLSIIRSVLPDRAGTDRPLPGARSAQPPQVRGARRQALDHAGNRARVRVERLGLGRGAPGLRLGVASGCDALRLVVLLKRGSAGDLKDAGAHRASRVI